MIGSGKRMSEIALDAESQRQDREHIPIARILLKMGMETNAQLIRYALQHGLPNDVGESLTAFRRAR